MSSISEGDTQGCLLVSTCMLTHVCTYLHTHTPIHINTQTYIYIYTHIYRNEAKTFPFAHWFSQNRVCCDLWPKSLGNRWGNKKYMTTTLREDRKGNQRGRERGGGLGIRLCAKTFAYHTWERWIRAPIIHWLYGELIRDDHSDPVSRVFIPAGQDYTQAFSSQV